MSLSTDALVDAITAKIAMMTGVKAHVEAIYGGIEADNTNLHYILVDGIIIHNVRAVTGASGLVAGRSVLCSAVPLTIIDSFATA